MSSLSSLLPNARAAHAPDVDRACPSSLQVGGGLGNSSGMMGIAHQVVKLVDRHVDSRAPYFASSTSTFQMYQALGMFLGATLSKYLSHGGTAAGGTTVSPAAAVVGGVCVAVGARLAGGCPSGSGLTGMGFLRIAAMVTVAGMFAGGGGAALLMGL